jgi:hypothetical protein
MDGVISVESEAGKGSAFIIQLKRVPNDTAMSRLGSVDNQLAVPGEQTTENTQ